MEDDLIGVGGVWQIVGREDEDLGKAAGLLLVGGCVARDLFEDAAIAVRRGDSPFHVLGGERALVLNQIELLGASVRIDVGHGLALPQENAVHFDIGTDGHRVPVDEEAIADRLIDAVAKHRVPETTHRVGGRGGSQADFDRVEVVEGRAPDAELLRRIAAMAFVGDDQIECVRGNLQEVGIVVAIDVVAGLREAALCAEQVSRDALDGAHIDEGVRGARRREVVLRQYLGVERLIVAEVLALEPLAEQLEFLRELEAVGSAEGIEFADGLCGERFAIDQEEDPSRKT